MIHAWQGNELGSEPGALNDKHEPLHQSRRLQGGDCDDRIRIQTVCLAKGTGRAKPVMSKAHGGYSRTARKRRRRAAALSQQMRHGDGNAAFRLLQRGRALQGIAKRGWGRRLALANAARQGKYKRRLAAAAVVAEWRRLEAQCTMKSPAVLAALRVRYGTGGVRGDYSDGECRPVGPGGKCPVCAWSWGSREPHLIAIP